MAANGNLYPYDGYPAPGARAVKIEWAGDVVGTANYQAGGYNLNASALGMSRLEIAGCSAIAQSNNYYARVQYPATSANNEARATGFSYVKLQWFAANGTEVANNTNLSAEIVQLSAVGI